jgi:alpha-glucosidase
MRTTEPKRKEDVRDPIGVTGWPKEKGRDGERTPMQWTPVLPNAGFTAPGVTPWLPVPPSARTVNVETEGGQPDSLLNFYKSLLRLRHTEGALMFGDYIGLNPDDPNVFSFLRRLPAGSQGSNIVVALNMSGEAQTVSFDLAAQKISGKRARVLEGNFIKSNSVVDLQGMALPPFGAVVLAVE